MTLQTAQMPACGSIFRAGRMQMRDDDPGPSKLEAL
jgi:hypothetical protein